MEHGQGFGWTLVGAPVNAGLDPQPALFFAGVMAMGAAAAVGLALYGRFVAPELESEEAA